MARTLHHAEQCTSGLHCLNMGDSQFLMTKGLDAHVKFLTKLKIL
jgi:hypothetical protein